MYKCKKCKGQSGLGEPQAKINYYRKDGSIEKEDRVCFYCKNKYSKPKEK